MVPPDIRGRDGKKAKMDPKARPFKDPPVEPGTVTDGGDPKKVVPKAPVFRKPPGTKPSKNSE